MRTTATAAAAALIFVLSIAFYSLYQDRGIMLVDEGSLVHASQRVANGEVPYRDFRHFYAPGRFYLLAGLFKAFGESLIVSRTMGTVVRAAVVTMVFLIGARVMPPRYAALPAAVTLLVPGPWVKSFYAFSALLVLLAELRYIGRRSAGRAAQCGLAVAAAILLRQDVGVWSAAVAASVIVLANAADRASARPCRRAAAHLALAGTAAAAVLLPAVLAFLVSGGLPGMVRQLFVQQPGRVASHWSSLFRMIASMHSSEPFRVVVYLVPPAVLLATLVILLTRAGRRSVRGRELPLFALLLTGALMLAPAYLQAGLIRLYQSASVAWILAAFLIRRSSERISPPVPGRRRAADAIAYGAALLLAAAFVSGALFVRRAGLASTVYSGTVTAALRNRRPVTLRGERIYLALPAARKITGLVDYVSSHTREGEPIVVLPLQSLLYYLCDRPNPTRFMGTLLFIYPGYEDEELWMEQFDDVRAASPRYMIVHRKFMKPRNPHFLRRYVKARYREEARFGEFLVMRRRDDSGQNRQSELFIPRTRDE